MEIRQFVRVVRSQWPERLHAEIFAFGEREIIDDIEMGSTSIESFASMIVKHLGKQGLQVGTWEPIGPCVMEATIQ